MADEQQYLDYLKRLTQDLRRTRRRLAEREREPIAVVGMSCRYPGGIRSPQDLWELLAADGETLSDFPTDRGWDLRSLFDEDPDRPGTSYARHGGFLRDAADFDADFFGIHPREALAMDPQQRLLLELSWEAAEAAGIDPLSLHGSETGVFVGQMYSDYGARLIGAVPPEMEGYLGTGSTASVSSGRVAYVFGLEGPTVTVDTACSSSLVALHLACQALRAGEATLALAGGVTVLSIPTVFVEFSRQRGLSRDGRCKSYADAADGAGWSEGIGMLMLERLSDAQRNGHQVLAVIRGSAVNQDGASNGLTAPNGPSQRRVIERALASADLPAEAIDAVEGHGTGTTLGDPIEAQALLATYGAAHPPERPLWLGSVKSNIGHAQAAAGVAGVIKLIMALRHQTLPRTLHVDRPSRQVDWSAGAVSLLSEPQPWPTGERPRRAAVSSFGASGTNAHLILEEAPATPAPQPAEPVEDLSAALAGAGCLPWVVSARSPQALAEQAARAADRVVAADQPSPLDFGLSLSGRAALVDRAVVLGGDGEELLAGLRELAAGAGGPGVVRGRAQREGRLAFLFTGQGAQRLGMGRELYGTSATFRSALDETCGQLDERLGDSLLDVMFGEGAAQLSSNTGAELDANAAQGTDRLDQTMFTQAALFALEVSLFRLLQEWGVRPDFLLGHSIGELAAAHVAGVLNLKDACTLVAARGRLMGQLPAGGAMVAVQATEQEALAALAELQGGVALAAVNGPESVVLSGEREALLALTQMWRQSGRKTTQLRVSHAFHSPLMEPMLAEFAAVARSLSFAAPQLPIVSNLSGEPISAERLCDPEHWVNHVRQPVRFADGVAWLRARRVCSFLELGPDGVLSAMVHECLAGDEIEALAVPVMRKGAPELGSLLGGLAEIWTRGAPVAWERAFAGSQARRVELPSYAFQRRRYWLDAPVHGHAGVAAGTAATGHPLLGALVSLADERGVLLSGRISLQSQPWLADHAVMGVAVVPGAALLELALRAGGEVGCATVAELTLERPLVLPQDGAVQLQVMVGGPGEDGLRSLEIHARSEDGEQEQLDAEREWTRHARGMLAAAPADPLGRRADKGGAAADELRTSWPPAGAEALDLAGLYERLADAGLEYGPGFRALTSAWRREGELFAEVALPAEQSVGGFYLHPALLDAALHTLAFADGREADRSLRLPFSWGGVSLEAVGAAALRVRLEPRENGSLSLTLADERGEPVARVHELALQPVVADALVAASSAAGDGLLELDWSELAAAQPQSAAGAASLALIGDCAAELVQALRAGGATVGTYSDLGALAQAQSDGTAPPEAVLVDCSAWLSADEQPPRAALAVCERVLALVQEWLAQERSDGAPLVLLTRDAVSASALERSSADGAGSWSAVRETASADPTGLALATVWGLVRAAQLEHPDRLQLVDLESGAAAAALPWALDLASAHGEPQFVLRAGRLLVPRLRRRATQAVPGRAALGERIADGTVLITGGTGGVGAGVARHLVGKHGVSHVLLASRGGAQADGAAELEAELVELGAQVTVAACDVSDRGALQALLAELPDAHPLRAVVHAAGVLDDGVIAALTPERLRDVLAPKVAGAWHLHELTRELDLAAFVLFSSLASVVGSPGQSGYAAANAFLDRLAAQRRALGLVAGSIAWGPWAARGMAGALRDADLARMQRAGILPLDEQAGLALFDSACAADAALLAATRLDLAAMRRQARHDSLPAVLRGLVRVPPRRVQAAADGSLAERVAAAEPERRRELVLGAVLSETALVLGHASAAAVDAGATFKDLGFDSLAAVELRNRLVGVCGVRLPATLVFDFPTPELLVGHLLGVLGGSGAAAVVVRGAVGVDEPVAIVGMGCRFPGGVGSPQGLWNLVASGRDAISGFPVDRGWDLEGLFDPDPGVAGTSYVREGGFLLDAAEFDAEFFGVAPREALAMDPQQRLLLEVAWEALEDGGIDPFSLRGTPAGVFAGVMLHDYALGLRRSQAAELEGYLGTGGAGSVVSGRIAYTLGLEGPAVTVDTACSSSLVALHLACQALRSGECSLALAGGVTVLATPLVFIEFARQRGLAVDGRCKSFAAGADGTAWSEGVGLLALERLSDARRNGRRVLGVVSGSAVNQDGASNGLTAPNGPSQQRVIGRALAVAGVAPGEVDVVEGHGTGTALGDPIEAQALIAAYGRGREVGRPLWLGSIKSNIGHAQAAAGVAGVIKMVMALRNGVLPRTLHVQEPSGEIDWGSGALALLREEVAWERGGRPRRAGVSSFGISGTNAHVILEEAPAEPATSRLPGPGSLAEFAQGSPAEFAQGSPAEFAQGSPAEFVLEPPAEQAPAALLPWVLSARSEPALRAQAQRLHAHVERAPAAELADVGLALATTRAAFAERAVVLGSEREQLLDGLRVLAEGRRTPAVVAGRASGPAPVAFLFTGQGAQRAGMGAELYDELPLFRATLDELCERLDAELRAPQWPPAPEQWPRLREAMFAAPGSTAAKLLHRTVFAQPALFALEVALFRLLESWGVKPDFLIGHSIGELAAAHVAGVLTLPDACRLVAARGRLMQALPRGGAMLAIEASEQEALAALKPHGGRVALAAVNGPAAVVISGERDAVDALAEEWRERGRKTRRLRVSHAFHSARMDGILEPFREIAEQLTFSPPQIPIVSNVTGELADPELLCSAGYWVDHVRGTVRFADGVRALGELGASCLLELGPDAVLSASAGECLPTPPLVAGALLRRERPERRTLLGVLADAWAHGAKLDWGVLLREAGATTPVSLPTYAFQRRRYWLAGGGAGQAATGVAATAHPLLDGVVALADDRGWLFTGRLSLDAQPWLADHAVLGTVLLPGAALLELALHAGAEAGCDRLQELTLQTPIVLSEHGALQLQVVLEREAGGAACTIGIYSRAERGDGERCAEPGEWLRNASGVLVAGDGAALPAELDERLRALAGTWPPPAAQPLPVDDLYARLARAGFDYGETFQAVRAAWRDGERVLAELALPDDGEQIGESFALHPALLDAAFHVAIAAGGEGEGESAVPFTWSAAQLYGRGGRSLRALLSAPAEGEPALLLANNRGEPVASVGAVVSRPVSATQLEAARHDSPHALLRLEWAPAACANEAGADAAEIVVLGGVDCELADALTRAGVQAACHPDLRSLVAALASGAAEAPDIALVRCPAPDVDAAPDALVALLELLQQWLAAKPLVGSRLALISSGAVAARPGEQVPAPSGAAAWGLVRSAQSEHPGRFALLDIDRADASWEALADALVGGEPQIALREGVALVPGLVTASATATHEQESAARPTAGGEPAHGAARASRALHGIEGTVLITGGLGGLGALVAERLVSAHGARRLLLVGRRGEQTPGAAELRTRLEGLGAEVQLAACDVADREQVAELLRSIPAEQPLRVVCHAAGVADNALVESLTEEQLQRVLEPKLRGAVNLDELTRELELDAFILFSSLAGVFGGPGQANYAAANAFLDGLAAQRQALGLVATSLAWGLWGGGVGLGGELGERDMHRLTGSAGLNVLAPDEALELFSAALAQPQAVVAPVHLDRVALRAEARAGTLPPLLRGLVRGPVRTSTRASRVADGLAGRLSGLSERERAAALRELVCDETAAVLGHASAAAVDAGATFKDLGFDSLAAVELRNRLVGVCGVRLPATLVFDFPTPELLVGHLLGVLGGSGAAAVVVRGAVGVDEPVAIVGMGCRFPGGVGSPQGLWDLVASGRDAISGFPVDRGWDLEGLFDPDPGVAGTSYVREGGFLLDAAEFDAEFFGVAPREALAMDPQQRLLLEVAWEALEDGGIDPFSLRGTPAGVFAGVMLHDYASVLADAADAEELEGYMSTGGGGSVVSGRIAYALGLEGPAVTVDTACSSSLVALHLACQALRAGECTTALAGGVAVLATPGLFVDFSRQRALAVDGRCKSFAAGADGTGWGEGVGVLVLERLSDARRNGRRVLGVVSGSAVNQDGASNGLTAPNGPSQQRVIGRALAVAGVAPGEVDVVEGHGTGTALGDPIEAQALIAAYGRGREVGRPLWLGSIKSNIGHAQAAAGVAGVIKMVMALRHGVLPRTLHVQEPSGEIDWGSGALALLREEVAWERGGRPRRAGVSSFGISGTNAHVILEEAPAEPATSRLPGPELPVERTPATEQEQVSAAAEVAPDVALDERADDDPAPPLLPWIVSARGANALRAQARRLMDRLASEPGLDVADVGYSLASTRSVFVNRAVVLARDVHQLRAALAALADGHAAENLLTGSAPGVGALAYMFTGQGSQRPRMGRELYAAFPIFRDAVDELGALLDAQLREQGAGNGQPSVREAMFAEPGSPEADRLAHTTFAQPALFMLEVGLFRLLESWDLKPDFLIGHSIGELAAAHVAGVLDAADACTLVAARGQLMGALPAGGAMVAVQASEADVGEELAGRDDRVALAAVNGPSAVVLSGDEDAVLELAQMWRERGCRTRRLEVSHAFHSPRMDAMLADFAAVAAGLSFSAPRIAIVSNLTGEQAPPELLCSADYWVNHVRETVRFADGVRWLAAHGTRCLLELGPDGVLSALAQECLPEPVAGGPLLRGERPEQESLLGALASAWTSGAAEVDWGAVVRARVAGARRVALPTYAFQRTRYWPARGRRAGDLRLAGQAQATHPLLGAATELAAGEGWLFTGRVALDTHPWLADHAVLGRVLVPGAALLELALHVAERVGCTAVRELTLQAPLELHEGEAAQLQVAVGSVGETGARTIEIHSRPERHEQAQWQAQWRRHATGELVVEDAPEIDTTTTASWPPPHAEPLALDGLYERLALRGLDYGPLFQGLRAAWQSGTELFAEIALPTQSDARGADFAVHPALLDAALHATLDGEPAAAEADEAPADVRLPFSWSGVRLHGRAAGALRAVLRPSGADGVSLLLADSQSGTPVVTVDALVARPVSAEQLEQALAGDRRPLLRLEWVPVSTAATESARSEAIDVLVDCDAPPAEHSPEQASARLDAVLERLQAWLAEEPLAGRRLVFVTRGAVAAEPSEDVSDLVGAAIWGLVRAAQAEHPGRFVLVDVDEHEVSRATLAQALSLPEPQLAIRLGAARVPRLARVAVAVPAVPAAAAPAAAGPAAAGPAAAGPAAASAGASFTGVGTTLVTGGTGGLGALIAEHLVRAHGVRRLLLVSRSGPDATGADALRERLQELGAHVELAACDVADREQLRELLAAIPREQPLKAVIHAAGVLDDGVLESLTRERLQQVLAPKLQGARNLHELTTGLELDAFVLFSSIAGVLGGAGQANYSAANAYLDALALHRRAHGLPAISMAWGLWEAAAGMGGRLAERERSRLGRGGIAALSASEGRELFDAACVAGEAAPVTVKLDAGALRTAARAGSLPPPLRGLVRVPARARTVAGGELARRVRDAKADAREGLLLELVRGEAAAVLGHASAQAIAPDSAFRDLGFDSLAAVELRNRLAAATALRLSATLVFDHPTPLALARWLVGELLDAPSPGLRPAAALRRDDPVAIVGMSCRYPGDVASPADLWDLLCRGAEGIGDFPTDRGWQLERLADPGRPGASRSGRGGFLYDATEFDAAFFGVSPRDALRMDPQQRLLLEAAWEALEDGGIDPRSLAASQTGVYVGLMYHDYAAGIDGYMSASGGGSVVAGGLAYTLGLQGPAVTIDTACSSSLVALHSAARALSLGECSLALAGGVTVMSTPGAFVEFSRQGALSADGRCRSFGAGADGTSWSEGVGVLLLERLSDARRNGHRVLALLRGSAVNQDGASNGLTAPNGPAQERVIVQALADAGLTAADVDVVEAHGTGTRLGDPIEAQALIATYGRERAPERPLWLGSLKSNIGHTQAAAGVAGVIKMVLALRHDVLPRTLHSERPSPEVDWSTGTVALLREPVAWDSAGGPRRAGISSFGISGTNAHVIVEEAPPEPAAAARAVPDAPVEVAAAGALPWLLSARDAPALRAQAQRLLEHLDSCEQLDALDVARSLVRERAALEHRALLVGADGAELLDGLRALAGGAGAPGVMQGMSRGPAPVAFLFTGQGAQRVGMGRELYGAFAVFADAFDEICARLDPQLPAPLRDSAFGPAEPLAKADAAARQERLDGTAFAQSALFALEVALYRLLASFGVRPAYLVGHSIGELAAAHVAGVLSLDDACTLVAARGRLMEELPRGGAMVAVEATEQELHDALGELGASVALAAVNDSRSVVLSGEQEAVQRLAASWREQGRRTRRLRVSHAFHSPRMDGMLEAFARVAAELDYSPPRIPIVSNLTGEQADAQALCSSDYWVNHVRETVRFGQSVSWLRERGVNTFLELGPDGVLSALVGDGAAPLLRGERPQACTLVQALGMAWTRGVDVDWRAVVPGAGRRDVTLPSYAFQRRRYWRAAGAGAGSAQAVGLLANRHPLLGAATQLAGEDGWLFAGRLAPGEQAWLADHAVLGAVLLPGTACVELALHAGAAVGCPLLDELTLEAPLVLAEQEAVQLQVTVGAPRASGERPIAIHSRPQDEQALAGGRWTRHASGYLRAEPPAGEPAAVLWPDTSVWPPPGARELPVAHLYAQLAELGFDYGPCFRGVRAAWRCERELYAEVVLPQEGEADGEGFELHPALLDAAFHAAIAAGGREHDGGAPQLPFAWRGVRLLGAGARALRVALRHDEQGALSLAATDAAGTPVIGVASLTTRPVSAEQLDGARRQHARGSLLRLDWPALPGAERTAAGNVTTVHVDCAGAGAGPELAGELRELLARTLRQAQEWVAQEDAAGDALVFVTQRAVAAVADEDVPSLAGAAVWGLVRSAQSEHPGRFRLIDVDASETSQAALAAALASDEPQLAIRDGVLHAPRLARIEPAERGEGARGEDGEGSHGEGNEAALAGGGTVLVTGGTGGLGGALAEQLVREHGVRELLLLSRGGPAASGAPELQARLGELGARVRIAACDVADREQLRDVLAAIPAQRPLKAVFHLAGSGDNALLESLTPERLQVALAAKVDGALHLHELTQQLDLEAFVLFSSLAGICGGPGQANYAAANACLDALAAHRRAQGLAASSFAWGLWTEIGLGRDMGEHEMRRMAGSASLRAVSPEQGLALFGEALASGQGLVVPVPVDEQALRVEARAGTLPALLRGLAGGMAGAPRLAAERSIVQRLAQAPPARRAEIVRELVHAEVAAVLGHASGAEIEPEMPFKDLGFDSLAAVELRNRLGAATESRLPATLVFDHPTPAAVVEHLLGEVLALDAPAGALENELDRLELALAAVSSEEQGSRVAARLAELLTRVQVNPAATASAEAAEQLPDSASADELYAFIDRQLGAQ